MSKVTGNDLKELKDLLNSHFEQLGKHISTLDLGQTEIKGQVAVIDSRLSTLELGQTEIKGQVAVIDSRLNTLELGQTEIKGQVAVIDSRLNTLELGQTEIKGQITEIKGQVAVVDSRLKTLETSSQKIPDLAEKVGELKNWKQIALSLGGALVGGFITYLLKTPNP